MWGSPPSAAPLHPLPPPPHVADFNRVLIEKAEQRDSENEMELLASNSDQEGGAGEGEKVATRPVGR